MKPANPRVPFRYEPSSAGGVTFAGLPGAVVGFVPKQIEMAELLEAVRDTLSRSPATPGWDPATKGGAPVWTHPRAVE